MPSESRWNYDKMRVGQWESLLERGITVPIENRDARGENMVLPLGRLERSESRWNYDKMRVGQWESLLERGITVPIENRDARGENMVVPLGRLERSESRRGSSSVGRTLPSHGRGQGFESPLLHHTDFSIFLFGECNENED